VYTVSDEGFAVQIKDPFQNRFNATYHADNYTQEFPFLKLSLVTDTNEQIQFYSDVDYPDVGLFTYKFTVYNLYASLLLTV
jgi:hypothetical protein